MGKVDVVPQPTMWCLGLAALMLMYTGARAMKLEAESGTLEPRLCHLCDGAVCAHPASGVCPAEQPFCATRARAPDFTSSLVCAASLDGQCSLIYYGKQQHEMMCVCPEHLCNAPFTQTVQDELIKFAAANNTGENLLGTFWNFSSYANFTGSQLYRMITVKNQQALNDTIMPTRGATVAKQTHTTLKGNLDALGIAQAEALKQEAGMIADDEDDEDDDGEGGSGLYEDSRLTTSTALVENHSYLPEEKRNRATTLFINVIILVIESIFFTI